MNDPGSSPPREGGANTKRSGESPPRDGGATQRKAGDDSLFGAMRGWLKGRRRPKGAETVRDALEELIEDRDSAEIPIDEHERQLLGNILHLRDVTAYDVMVPRADIVAVEAKISLEGLIALFIDCGHSRLPVYRRSLDDVIGMIHIKDLLEVMGEGKAFNLPRLARRVQFVAPSMRVTDLLLEMRLKRSHLALVVDEYGGIDGLVTIEDLVEQIVGEIEDEHDQDEEPELTLCDDGTVEADGRTPIAEFEDRMGAVLTEEEREEVETLGGLVSFVAGRVPSRGELITHSAGLEFEVLDADPRRVKRVRVRRVASLEPAATE
ncbi:Magnesium and cobalt efflux protein CorC [Paramagnetospirillum magnetotacticum MS-1]|uniref:Magnesium and cobalt efflux protein CorC n=1 Tax=Paramagnetospirillum magnetotacticum MS-1 TaxID=272627 RepID=A0A0C2U8X6_PARME|nr:hemolysin family protein [Paramagnetospirillum magnetotacticum]KIL97947.1 Magnesium and cobalt efflux protein CorC [Paramagnetospirillum magnetotacticum MS-1]